MTRSGKTPGHQVQGARQTLTRPPNAAPETVEGAWLLKAGALALAVALVCAYVTVCGLFMHGEWQLVLHPARIAAHTPDEYGLKAEDVRFGADRAVHGWWVASDSVTDPTVLMLPSGNGSAADWLERASTLHRARLNVLLFDYRGYGPSGGQHPDEKSMEADSESGLDYLTGARGVAASSLIVFGAGAGASLAVRLCGEHAEIPALVLEDADGDFAERARLDARARIAPFDLLFNQDFPLADRLHALKTPKLLISYTKGSPPVMVQRAADPKTMLEIPSANDDRDVIAGVRRFVDSYVAHPAGTLIQIPSSSKGVKAL